MTSAQRIRDQRRRLWHRQGGRCYWCGKLTVLPPENCGGHRKNIPRNEATIDHLDSRLSPDRGKWNGCYRRVMACLRCNNRRARIEFEGMPIQAQWEHTGVIYGIAKLSGALNEVCRP